MLEFAAELFSALAVELCAHHSELRELVKRIEALTAIPPVVLGREVLRAPQLIELPTAVAIEVQLTLLLAFSDARAASLWTSSEQGEPEYAARAGELDSDAPQTTGLARTLLTGERGSLSVGDSLFGVLVDGPQHQPAALIVRGTAESSAAHALLAETTRPGLSAALARGDLLRGREASQLAVERRLSRLRFDLHDGPQQDVIMLAEDLRLLGDQLADVIDKCATRDRALGRVADLEARLIALDGDLRRISGSLLSPFLHRESLPESIQELSEAFTARTHIEPEIRLEGDLTGLTDSQQITLLALIRESLANVRDHSDAEHVTVTLSAGQHGIDATVTDDGRGFDPETTLMESARDGHLGLVSMHERARLLGGRTKIDSRPGGPTVVSVTLPPMPAVDRSGQ